MHFLPRYKPLLELSRKMEKLASEQAWDDLIATESERRRLFDNLLASLPSAQLARLPQAEQQAIATLIRQIQNCDQTVREYVLPWQENVGTLLAHLEPKP